MKSPTSSSFRPRKLRGTVAIALQYGATLGILLTSAPWGQSASLSYAVFGTTTYEPTEFHFDTVEYNPSDPILSITAPDLTTTFSGPYSAYTLAEASYGELKVGAEIYARTDLSGSYAAASASWTDSIVITGGGLLTGVFYTYHAILSFQGSSYAFVPEGESGFLRSTYQLDVILNNNQLPALRLSGEWKSRASDALLPSEFSGTDPTSEFSVDIIGLFTPEVAQTLTVTLDTGVESFLGSSSLGVGRAYTDFTHTLTWLGITEVRDMDGNLVTDYSVSSESGTDWTQPIPEPSSATLALLGIVTCATLRRIRR